MNMQTPETHPDQEYFEYLAQGRFMLQRSRSSGRFVFYPRVAEPVTGNRDLEWVAPSGLGTVHAVTVMRPKPPQSPYNVVIVELDEGPRMMSRVEGIAPESVRIGLRIRAKIVNDDGKALVVFEPAEDGA